MAIEPVMADIIRQLAPTLPNRRVLSLGYPDILTLADTPTDPERVSIAAWHRWSGGIEDAGHFFGKQELEPEYWDVTQARGPERVVDLNEVTQDLYGHTWFSGDDFSPRNTFGLVIDPGTIEHIANIGNCWRILCAVTARNGFVIHSNPLTMANHGFYSIHPTAYADIYEANGFKVEMMVEMSGPREKRVLREVPPYARYQPAADSIMLVVARKLEDVPFVWPTQRKYRVNPMLKASQ